MEIKINKNFFIKFGVIICLCFTSFCTGRFIRLRGISEDGIRTEQQVERLTEKVGKLETELQARIEQCEQLEGQLNSVGIGIDESIRTAGSIRDEIRQGTEELRGSSQIIIELRRRFNQYENRIGELEENLKRVKTSSSEQ
jgi:chromosome segregation ATPase